MKLGYIDTMSIGKKIKYLRELKGMTQEELANLLYVSKQVKIVISIYQILFMDIFIHN